MFVLLGMPVFCCSCFVLGVAYPVRFAAKGGRAAFAFVCFLACFVAPLCANSQVPGKSATKNLRRPPIGRAGKSQEMGEGFVAPFWKGTLPMVVHLAE